MVLATDYLALVIATVVVLCLSVLNHYHQPASVLKKDFQNRLVQSAQVLLVVSWILILLVRD